MINIYGPSTYLLECVHERPVEEVPNEELITAGDGRGDVTKSQSGTVCLSIGELAASSNDYANHIKNKGSCVKLPARR